MFRSLCVALGLALVMALCAGTALAADLHACDYLSQAQVEQVMGLAVEKVDTQKPNPLGQSICFFDLPANGMKPRFAQLQLTSSQHPSLKSKKMSAASLFKNNMSFLEGGQEVPGIGERAVWGGSGLKLGAGLHVLYKDFYFNVMVASGDAQGNLDKSKALAALVIKNIDAK